ncbi:PREDICTED: transcription repressor OFP8 [Camelina sativa]|uniref:Transcription repressor n=1 Tax=Camelina sativa TaxID=90675 RepID=A0ABM0T4I8_CAMSA|nr:PREDICTED: transcription repressor OFP8 [Camelina sativa]
MEKRMKLRVSRMVRSSLNSCRPRDLYDVVETSAVTSQATSSERFFVTEAKTSKTPRPKSHHHHAFSSPHYASSSIFPPNPFYEESRSFRDLRKKVKTNRKQRSSQFGSDPLFASRFKSTGSWYWSCSEEEEEDEGDKEEESDDDSSETLFSSRSFSSDTSSKAESFAVVKKSKDPYEDFRTSMVEMIVERQIFAAAELQKLLQCFLSLNSRQHHKVIVQVFLEIYATLFSP